MSRSRFSHVFAAAILLTLAGNAGAQETSPAGNGPPRSMSVPQAARTALRVQLVISRFEGEKKLASLPYTFLVATGTGRAEMRMGVDAPVPTGSTPDGKPMGIQYRNIGTNISCTATELADGRYGLRLDVQYSSALPATAGSPVGSGPMFRNFTTSLDQVLRDGQSVQTIASTDPVSGEVVKIDVTMNVVR